jgi:tetratricopeptide (TPR) repeat protein
MAALIVVNVIIYAPVRHYDFVQYDDPKYVSENPYVSQGLTLQSVVWAFTTRNGGYWIPLTWLTYMADVQISGMNAGALHVTNVLLHIANTLLLFGLLRRMTGALGRSAFVAALFAIHPLHVESVAWITERKDVLSTLFLILVLWAYVAYVRRPGLGRYLMVNLLFALGLMAKPMLVTLPFALLLLDVWPLGRVTIANKSPGRSASAPSRDLGSVWLRLVWEKLPLMALAAASSIVTYAAQGEAVSGLDVFPFGLRVENALVSFVAYLGQMFWPARLAVLYPFLQSVSGWGVAGSLLALAGVSAAVLRAARHHPYLPVGWLWYLGTLVPVSGLVQAGLQSRADRFTYVPLIGIFIIVAWGVPDLLARCRYQHSLLQAGTVLVIAACTITARSQVRYWKDNVSLWTHASEVTLNLDTYRAHISLGAVLREQGRFSEAFIHFSEAIRLNPGSAEAHREMGFLQAKQGKFDEAVASFTEAVRLKPDFAETQSALGMALSRQGKVIEAIEHLSEAVRLQPDSADLRCDLGSLLVRQGRIEEAIASFSAALRLKPDYELAHINLGAALVNAGRVEEAIHEFMEVLQINPKNDVARRAIDDLTKRSKHI